MKSPGVVNFSSEPHSVELREVPRPVAGAAAPAANPTALYETTGRIERLETRSVTLSHQPVPALQWPAMTMEFKPPPLNALPRHLEKGDHVTIDLNGTRDGAPVIGLTTEDWLYEIGRGWVAPTFDDELVGREDEVRLLDHAALVQPVTDEEWAYVCKLGGL